MKDAAQYVSLNIGHHLIKWAISRIRAGTMTPEQFAAQHSPNARPDAPVLRTITLGIRQIMHEKPENLPETLR
jgi:hypothetical protein